MTLISRDRGGHLARGGRDEAIDSEPRNRDVRGALAGRRVRERCVWGTASGDDAGHRHWLAKLGAGRAREQGHTLPVALPGQTRQQASIDLPQAVSLAASCGTNLDRPKPPPSGLVTTPRLAGTPAGTSGTCSHRRSCCALGCRHASRHGRAIASTTTRNWAISGGSPLPRQLGTGLLLLPSTTADCEFANTMKGPPGSCQVSGVSNISRGGLVGGGGGAGRVGKFDGARIPDSATTVPLGSQVVRGGWCRCA